MNRTSTTRLSLASALAMVLLSVVQGCSTGPEDLDLAGTWTGTTSLPDDHATTLELARAGVTIAGTMEISGLMNQAFVGTLDEGRRAIDWALDVGCEAWSGSLDINSDSDRLSGPVMRDASACTSGTDLAGTMAVSKQ